MSYKIIFAGGTDNLCLVLIPPEADSLIDQELTLISNALCGNI